MNAPRTRLVTERSEHDALAEHAWKWHCRWRAAHRGALIVSALSFVCGAVWPLVLVATGMNLA
jgi:hypothetical protein